jgi:hypothetical protein
MRSNSTAVFGIYKNSAQAESAVDRADSAVNTIVESRTVAGGFTHEDISVLLPDAKARKILHTKNTPKLPKEPPAT